MELLETGAGDAALENAKVLLCIDIERLLVDMGDEEVVVLKVVGLIARRKIRLVVHCDWRREPPKGVTRHKRSPRGA
jgi:hypothetical protein